MTESIGTSFVAECFWAGVKPEDLRRLDERAESSVAELSRDGEPVRYLGSMLMREDEVVLCFFEGSAANVRRAAESAKIPFERILETTGAGGPMPAGKRTPRSKKNASRRG